MNRGSQLMRNQRLAFLHKPMDKNLEQTEKKTLQNETDLNVNNDGVFDDSVEDRQPLAAAEASEPTLLLAVAEAREPTPYRCRHHIPNLDHRSKDVAQGV